MVTDFMANQERLGITYLPPYSPELNPVERVWVYVERHQLANFRPGTMEELQAYLSKVWPKIPYRQSPAKVLGLDLEARST